MRLWSCATAHAANPTPRRRQSNSMMAWKPRARTAGRRCASICCAFNSLLSPFLGAGFYYKTFMWPPAFWERVYEPLIRRAAGLGRAAGCSRSRPLRAGQHLLRRAGHRRRSERACGGACSGTIGRAGHPLRGGFRARRPAACRAARDRRHARPPVGVTRRRRAEGAARSAADAAHDRVRRLRRRHLWCGRTRLRSPAGPAAASAAAAPLADRRTARRARGRRTRTRHRVRRQRPAGHHAGVGDAQLRQPLRGRTRPAGRDLHQQRRRLAHRKRSRGGRDRGRGGDRQPAADAGARQRRDQRRPHHPRRRKSSRPAAARRCARLRCAPRPERRPSRSMPSASPADGTRTCI